MANYGSTIGQDLLNVPMGDMIRDMAFAIAEAQTRLDLNSIEVAEMMGGLKTIYDKDGNVTFEDSRVFFGQQKVKLQDALDIYNNTGDQEMKELLDTNIISNTAYDNDIKTGTGGKKELKVGSTNPEVWIPNRLSMMELGFAPTFYQFVDTIIEVKITITISEERASTVDIKSDSKTHSNYNSFSFSRSKNGLHASNYRQRTVTTTQVNASYSNKYNYSAEGSSLLRTKLSPVPAPVILEERIRQQMELLDTKS